MSDIVKVNGVPTPESMRCADPACPACEPIPALWEQRARRAEAALRTIIGSPGITLEGAQQIAQNYVDGIRALCTLTERLEAKRLSAKTATFSERTDKKHLAHCPAHPLNAMCICDDLPTPRA